MAETITPISRRQLANWSDGLVVITSDQYLVNAPLSEAVPAECQDDIDKLLEQNKATYQYEKYPVLGSTALAGTGADVLHQVDSLLGVTAKIESELELAEMRLFVYSRISLDKVPHRDDFYGERDGIRITASFAPGTLWWEGERSRTTHLDVNDLMVQELRSSKAKQHAVSRASGIERTAFCWDFVAQHK